jgi:hypothetical protein
LHCVARLAYCPAVFVFAAPSQQWTDLRIKAAAAHQLFATLVPLPIVSRQSSY